MRHPVSPYLVYLLKDFLSPIETKIEHKKGLKLEEALTLATGNRLVLVVFLENYIAQFAMSEFDIDYSAMNDIYAALQQKLNEKEWREKHPTELRNLGVELSAILYDWQDIKGTTYVSNPRIFSDLLIKRMPKLLDASYEYATALGYEELALQIKPLVKIWREILALKQKKAFIMMCVTRGSIMIPRKIGLTLVRLLICSMISRANRAC